jgi:hypothetical protein
MSVRGTWRQGDHLVTDDVTGFTVLASKTRKQWDGAIVHESVFETRHPQDLIRARREKPGVTNGRPPPVDTFIGPLTTTVTAATPAGSTDLPVESTARMEVGDAITVMLDSGDAFRVLIAIIVDSTTLTLAAPLPQATSEGKSVINNTAQAAPTLP